MVLALPLTLAVSGVLECAGECAADGEWEFTESAGLCGLELGLEPDPFDPPNPESEFIIIIGELTRLGLLARPCPWFRDAERATLRGESVILRLAVAVDKDPAGAVEPENLRDDTDGGTSSSR